MVRRLWVAMTIFTFIITAFTLGLYTFWMSASSPLSIENANSIQVDKKQYHAWDRISYTLSYCKKHDIQWTISRALVNAIRINYTEFVSSLSSWCGIIVVNDMVIPEFIDGGIYHIETTIRYVLNPVKTVYNRWNSVEFMIVEEDL